MARRPTSPARRRSSRGSAPPTRPAPPSEPATTAAGPRRRTRFGARLRAAVTGRPWRRRRRAITAAALAVVLLAVGALAALIWLPALRVQEITVSGLGYVEEQAVVDVLAPQRGESVLLLPTSAVGEEVAELPGVSSAEVERRWPDGVHVTVTEREPASLLTRPDGSTAILDAEGTELPEAAAEGATLVPMTVDGASADPDGASAAMSEVLAELPDPLRGAVQEVTASSRSDVTLVLSLDAGEKTVVWGDARDAELKGEVVQVLIDQPGDEIDVSSPVAPVTR